MTWQKFSLTLPVDLADTVTDTLNDAGALAVTLEAADTQEIFEAPLNTTPLWNHTRVVGLFDTDTDLTIVLHTLQHLLHPHPLHYHITPVFDQDWQKNCTDAFQPICFADKLWVYPSWQPAVLDGKPRLLLDPGLAFGTGSHPTTALCLSWLATHIQGGETVIDYGCGSGILGLAAATLGATSVWCVDIDPQALESTQQNAQRNSINLHTTLPEQLPLLTADVIIANILANPLVDLASHLAQLLRPGGKIALSGILIEQIDQVTNAYQPWINFSAPMLQHEWAGIHGKKV